MENNEMIATDDAIKQELIEIINKPEILSSFNEVFQKYSLSANKTITIELKVYDTTEPETVDRSEKISALSSTVAVASFGSTWCPSPPCMPPPGKWLS